MGTSTKWRGPHGGGWSAATQPLRRLDRILLTDLNTGNTSNHDRADTAGSTQAKDDTKKSADRYWNALRDDLAEDADAYGLRVAMSQTGTRLVDTLNALSTAGIDALGPLTGNTADERVDIFITRFVQRVAGVGGRPVDAAVRRSVASCAAKLLEDDPRLHEAVERGDTTSGWKLGSDVLCALYQLFFAQPVAQFIKAVVTGKLIALFPPIHIIDPANEVANWISTKVTGLIPDPCAEKDEEGDDGGTVADLARSLVQETVRRILGLPPDVAGDT